MRYLFKITVSIFFGLLSGFLFSNLLFLDGARADSHLPAPDGASGHLKVFVDVSGVKIFLNGELEGLAHPDHPLTRRFLPEGRVTVRAESRDYPSRLKKAQIIPGKTVKISFHFHPDASDRVQDAADAMCRNRPVSFLMEQAEKRFKAKKYTRPEDDNAFAYYACVLEKDPQHARAQKRIMEMLNIYDRLWKTFSGKGRFEKEKEAIDYYLQVLNYADKHFSDDAIREKLDAVTAYSENLSQNIETIQRLLRDGDLYFIAQRFTEPAEENAFNHYKAVLEMEPANRHARDRIREMLVFYQKWGDSAWKRENRRWARSFYTQYMDIVNALEPLAEQGFRIRAPAELKERFEQLEHIQQLTTQGDLLLEKGWYVYPEEHNALDIFKMLLAVDPGNQSAWTGLTTMMTIIREAGDTAFTAKNYMEARDCYEQYTRIISFLFTVPGHPNLETESESIRDALDATDRLLIMSGLDGLKIELAEKLRQYEALKDQESRFDNVTDNMIRAIEEILTILAQIEYFYQNLPDTGHGIDQKLDHLRETRKQLEKELHVRQKKAS